MNDDQRHELLDAMKNSLHNLDNLIEFEINEIRENKRLLYKYYDLKKSIWVMQDSLGVYQSSLEKS